MEGVEKVEVHNEGAPEQGAVPEPQMAVAAAVHNEEEQEYEVGRRRGGEVSVCAEWRRKKFPGRDSAEDDAREIGGCAM